ncbi:MAG: hypothetical protein IT436_00160 [Phycisphaerales bacterium]|nr:hypothetical protein [Phycisphaerales bacterium]
MRGWRGVGWVAAALAVVLAAGCRREPSYSQASADEVIQSAKLMVKNGRADRLTDLIYAENADMRGLYKKLGGMLRSAQTLTLTLNEKFPKEVAALRAKAEQAAKDGKGSGLFGRLTGEARRGARRAATGERPNQGDAMDSAFKQILTDPYGWLDENSSKLATTPINDDMAAVTWDGKPVFPPLGLVIKKDGEKWFLVLPTNLPGVSGFMPKTKDEFAIWRSLIRTFDNAVVELNEDVKTGKARSLDDVARKAGEKAFVPAGIAFIAYGRAVEVRKEEARKQKAKAAAPAAPDAGAAPAGGN